MKIAVSLALISLLSTATPSRAAEPVAVLGLPLGGKLPTPVRQCKHELPKRAVTVCWIYSSKGHGGNVSGGLRVPGQDDRPAWAAYAQFEAKFTRDGTLREFTVESDESHSFKTIVDSISARFGRPANPAPLPSYSGYASWDRQEIGISILCKKGGKCYTKFSSADLAADNRKRLQEVVKRNAARPIAP